MSNKIRAGDILNEAFQFGYQRWFTVFRYGWLAMLIGGLLAYGAVYFIFDISALKAADDAAGLATLGDYMRVPVSLAVLIGLIVIVAVMLIYAGFLTSVFRLVGLGEDSPGIAQLRVDGPAQRVFWAQLILSLISLCIGLFSVIVAIIFSGHGIGAIIEAFQQFSLLVIQKSMDPTFTPSPEQMDALAGPFGTVIMAVFISLPLSIFIGVKLAPFVAGSACENRLILFGSYRMTDGHFWALFGLYLLFFMAMIVIGIIYSMLGGFLDVMTNMGGALAPIAILFSVISFAVTVAYQIFILGVQLSLQAIVYRTLKEGA